MWEDEDYCLSPTKSAAEWDSDRISGTFRHSVRGSSPLSLSDLDMWDTQGHSKAQSSTWYGMASVSGSGFLSKAINRQSEPPGMRRWQSMSRLAPEGAPRSYSSSPGAELRAALEESGFRRAELVQRLRDAHGRLNSQTDFLKSKDTQLQYTTATSQILDMKHKQLAQAVSALEQEKDAAELSRFEESQRRAELQDKVLKLEMEMLKMRSALQMGNICQPPPIQKGPSLLSRTLPVTQEDFYKEGRQKAERELVNLREALKEAEGRAEALETEKDQALQQLHSSEERAVLVQSEQLHQRLSHTMQTNSDLQEQLSEARSKLGQACLERDLLSTKALRLEESVEDLKAKLSGSLSDKGRLLQDKVDLHQKAQGLELQLERAQQGRESYTNQVCELHDQLAEAKIHTNRHDQETVRVKEELLSVREVNDKLECELELVKQRLESSLREHHELTAVRVIHANQIAALEMERTQLIGEKEELLSRQHGGEQEVLAELNDSCGHLRESQKTLESETQRLQEQCLCLEAEILEKEGEMELRDEEHQRKESTMTQKMEELRGVVSHWTDKWQEVALKLLSTERELEELQTNNSHTKTLEEEAARLSDEVESLQAERQRDKKEIQDLLQHQVSAEREAQSLLQVELDACKQELELERSSQILLRRQERGSNGDEDMQTLDKGTETEPNMPTESFFQELSGSNNHQNDVPQVSVKEMDGELAQEKTELQEVWDLLRIKESELEKQQQEVQSVRDHMSRQTVAVQRLEQELAQREQNLRESEHALKSLERLTEVERTETQIKTSALELQLLKVREQSNGSSQNKTKDKDTLNIESLQGQLEESRRRATQLELERDQAVQRLQSLRQPPQGKRDKTSPESKQEKTPVDQEKQRRLVTEQLKTLFKERELLVPACNTSAPAESGGHPLLDEGSRSKVVKTPSGALHSQRQKQQDLQRERSRQKGTGLRPVSEEQEDDEDPHCQAGQEAEQATVARLREELHDKSLTISAMSLDISSLKATNENLLKAKTMVQQRIQGFIRVPQLHTMRTSEPEVPSPSRSKGGDAPIYSDGIFLARQVEICSPDEDEEN